MLFFLVASDLYGAIGYPLKLARTIITGKNAKLVGQLLNILSYFIRCTEVYEHNLLRVESEEKPETCCLCSCDSELDICHKHSICESCIEKSGLSICVNCQKLIPKELNEFTLSDKSKELPKKLLQGLPCCNKCGLLQKHVNGLIRLNTMSESCTCLPKWAVAKELKHFLSDLTYTERSETFKCYCCEDEPSVGVDSEAKATFQCYCIGDNKCNHCNSKRNGFKSTSNEVLGFANGTDHNLDDIFMELLSHDQFCAKLECTCDSIDDSSCSDIDSDCHDSVDKVEVDSTDSYGRSGSLDSGFHQSSSSCAKDKNELECLSVDTIEDDEFGPEELPLLGLVAFCLYYWFHISANSNIPMANWLMLITRYLLCF